MTTHCNMDQLERIKDALSLSIEDLLHMNLEQDVACVASQTLEAALQEVLKSNHGTKIVDDMPTRYLFADPRLPHSNSLASIHALGRFVMTRRPNWSRVSGFMNIPAEHVIREMRSAGIKPTLAFELFLKHFKKERSGFGIFEFTT